MKITERNRDRLAIEETPYKRGTIPLNALSFYFFFSLVAFWGWQNYSDLVSDIILPVSIVLVVVGIPVCFLLITVKQYGEMGPKWFVFNGAEQVMTVEYSDVFANTRQKRTIPFAEIEAVILETESRGGDFVPPASAQEEFYIAVPDIILRTICQLKTGENYLLEIIIIPFESGVKGKQRLDDVVTNTKAAIAAANEYLKQSGSDLKE